MNTRDLKRPDRPTRRFSPEELRELITNCKTDPEDVERIKEWYAGERAPANPETCAGHADE